MKKVEKKADQIVDWNEIERQLRELRFKKIPPEEKLKEAMRIADIYRKAGKPLPNYIAALV